MTSNDWPSPPCSLSNGMRWNSNSHAVIATSGSAAASAKSRLRGIAAANCASTNWNCALLPGRVTSPA